MLLLALSPLLTLAPGSMATPPAAMAASKSKNRPVKQRATVGAASACQIKRSKTTWKLQANCTITTTIEIPNGVTFDGNGKTITMTGPVRNFASSNPEVFLVDPAILAAGGSATIKDLTIVGSGLTGECFFDTPAGIVFANTTGTIEKVMIRDVRIDGPPLGCGYGISILYAPGKRVSIRDTVVSGSPTRGISASSEVVELRKTRVTMTTLPFTSGTAIDLSGPTSVLEDATVDVQMNPGVNQYSAVTMSVFGSAQAPRLSVKNLRVQGASAVGLAVSAFDVPAPMDVSIDTSTIASTLPYGSGVSLSGSIDARIKDSGIRVPG